MLHVIWHIIIGFIVGLIARYRQVEIPLTELTIQRSRQLASNRSRYPTGRDLSLVDIGLSARPA